MKRWHGLVPAMVALLTIAAPLTAYSVQPMIYTLSPSGAGSAMRLTVANTRDSQLNVELLPFRVTADDKGKRSFTPAPDDFLLFPPQASIAPDKAQIFQLRYIGAPDLAQGKAYVIRVHQTNTIDTIKNEPGANAQTQLKLALNFNTTALVQPRGATGQLALESDLSPDDKGVGHARIVNRGNAVADLTQAGWTVERAGEKVTVPLQDVNYGDAVFLEPGKSRDIALSPAFKDAVHLTFAAPAGRRGTAAN